jgi:uncharacterized protein YjaG (DUF416 family)
MHDLKARMMESRDRLRALSHRRRIAFAAFWAQRSVPTYLRLNQRSGFGDPRELQRCLDRAWLAVHGRSPNHSLVHASLHLLERLTPELETYPLLGYAGIQSASAVSNALELADRDDVELAIRAMLNFEDIVEYVVMRQHAPLRSDAQRNTARSNYMNTTKSLLATLADDRSSESELVELLRAGAVDQGAMALADELDQLAFMRIRAQSADHVTLRNTD